ncbi:uncharacterized protein LOC131859987 [Cryptomeria japonica]|uniref:uncharacterized protein LOC131859987 n=1 Tax=Cryptomeria japonica TaxID=3369 RepID=UPI0027D9F667|nr:uncharacterized protein LOC131859987 [Cryptomeria japonica]
MGKEKVEKEDKEKLVKEKEANEKLAKEKEAKEKHEKEKEEKEKINKEAKVKEEKEKRRQEELKAKEGGQTPKAIREQDQTKQVDLTSRNDPTLACFIGSKDKNELLRSIRLAQERLEELRKKKEKYVSQFFVDTLSSLVPETNLPSTDPSMA